MEEKIIEKVDELLEQILEQGINQNNLDSLYKLSKIKHMVKEDKEMNGNYGNYGRGRYGEYNGYGYRGYGEYGRRGYDAKYRGYDALEAMGDNYGRYMESRERYGASHESSQSLKKMLDCMEDFSNVVKEQAQSPEEEQMMKETFRRISM